jgi:uncharacterized protein with FMN-binding domain
MVTEGSFEDDRPWAPAPAPPPTTRRRQHPSEKARAVALVASIGATGVIGAAMVLADSQATPTTVSAVQPSSSSAVTAAAAGTSRTTTPPATSRAAGYPDGTFLGAAEYTKWGDLQVQVTIANGKIAAVTAVQSPSDRKSARINARAQPVLEQEAVAAQSADVDIVSGATYTSETYKQSLQSALDAAAAAHGTTSG